MTSQSFSNTFFIRQAIALTLLTLFMVLIMQWLPAIDFAVSAPFFDHKTQQFIYGNHWLWRYVLHDDARRWLKPLQILLLAMLVFTAVWPAWRRYRLGAIYVLLCIVCIDTAIAGLKWQTHRACPVNLDMYGGRFHWQPLFSDAIEQWRGRCWPGGHALHAFILWPLYFAFRHWQMHRTASVTGWLIVVLGTVFSVTQIVRGQHFLSHQLASLIVCWAIALLGLWCLQRVERPVASTSPIK